MIWETHIERVLDAVVQENRVQIIVCFLQQKEVELSDWECEQTLWWDLQHHLAANHRVDAVYLHQMMLHFSSSQPAEWVICCYSHNSPVSVNSSAWASSAGRGNPPQIDNTGWCTWVRSVPSWRETGDPGRWRGATAETWWMHELPKV